MGARGGALARPCGRHRSLLLARRQPVPERRCLRLVIGFEACKLLRTTTSQVLSHFLFLTHFSMLKVRVGCLGIAAHYFFFVPIKNFKCSRPCTEKWREPVAARPYYEKV